MAKDAKKTQSNKKNIKEENKKEVKTTKKEIHEEVKKEEVKATKVKKENNFSKKATEALNKIDDHRTGIILFVVGFLVATLLFRCILWPDRIATLKDGTQPIATLDGKNITADDLYTSMKNYYSVKVFLNNVDKLILNKKYPDTDEMKKEIQSTADYQYQVYEKNYGYTKDKFLSEYGFASEADFLESLSLDYRRNKYYEEYAKSLVTDKEIEKYYENDVFGDVDSKHILVSIKKDSDTDGLTDSEAKALAEEIIGKLNNGTSWDDIITEYGDKITHEELGYQAFNASLESAYLKECKDLAVGSYSKTPVLTSYGYHIVYKIAQKDKPELNNIKDDVIEVLAKEKKNNDTNLYYKALINLREKAKLEFTDTKLKDEYNDYINSYK